MNKLLIAWVGFFKEFGRNEHAGDCYQRKNFLCFLLRASTHNKLEWVKVLHYLWQLHVNIEKSNRVLESLRLKIEFLAYCVHPINPKIAVRHIESTRIVYTAIFLLGNQTSENSIHRNLSMETLAGVSYWMTLLNTRPWICAFDTHEKSTRLAIAVFLSHIIPQQFSLFVTAWAINLNRWQFNLAPFYRDCWDISGFSLRCSVRWGSQTHSRSFVHSSQERSWHELILGFYWS